MPGGLPLTSSPSRRRQAATSCTPRAQSGPMAATTLRGPSLITSQLPSAVCGGGTQPRGLSHISWCRHARRSRHNSWQHCSPAPSGALCALLSPLPHPLRPPLCSVASAWLHSTRATRLRTGGGAPKSLFLRQSVAAVCGKSGLPTVCRPHKRQPSMAYFKSAPNSTELAALAAARASCASSSQIPGRLTGEAANTSAAAARRSCASSPRSATRSGSGRCGNRRSTCSLVRASSTPYTSTTAHRPCSMWGRPAPSVAHPTYAQGGCNRATCFRLRVPPRELRMQSP